MKLDLSTITLVSAQCKYTEQAIQAMQRCLNHADFKNAYAFTNEDVNVPDQINKIQIEGWDGYRRGCSFYMHELPKYTEPLSFGSHILFVQYDSWIVNPDAWMPEFLEYDYIGARSWEERIVGNGGFALYSAKMLLTMLEFSPYVGDPYPLDRRISTCWRPVLEDCDIRFASNDIADKFSVDLIPYTSSFGWHGVTCYRLSDRSVIRGVEISPADPGYNELIYG